MSHKASILPPFHSYNASNMCLFAIWDAETYVAVGGIWMCVINQP